MIRKIGGLVCWQQSFFLCLFLTLTRVYLAFFSLTIMRLASLIVVDSGGKMSSLFEVTSGKLSGDRTQRRV